MHFTNTSQLQIILHVFKCIMPTQLVFLIYQILAHLEGTVSINHHLNRRFFLVNNPEKINTNDISYMRRSTMSLNVCMMCLKFERAKYFFFWLLATFDYLKCRICLFGTFVINVLAHNICEVHPTH